MAVVVIGKDEGARLRACIASLASRRERLVYVDSGSTDGSREWACTEGVVVVELPPERPFSAAAARNLGLTTCLAHWPDTVFVQFVDGDCKIAPGWIDVASELLSGAPDVAAVCGRLHEADPTGSVYKLLCDLEFRGAAGDVSACGGIFMGRAEALCDVGGFDAGIAAGEEPELCLRLRRGGWRIVRLAADMGTHESSMYRFRQWWKRMERGGFAYATGRRLHGRGPERYCVAQTRSILLWTIGVAAAVAAATAALGPVGLVTLACIPIQVLRVSGRRRAGGDTRHEALVYAVFVMLGKWAQLVGMARGWRSTAAASTFDYKKHAATDAGAAAPGTHGR